MAKRKKRKERRPKREREAQRNANTGREVPTADYTDPEGNVLTLRSELSDGTIRKIGEPPTSAAASQDDAWRRRSELLFERLAVNWEVAGLPLDDQKMLLGRYRMANPDEQRWVRETIEAHLREHIPELAGGAG